MVEPVTLGVVVAALVAKAVDRAEDKLVGEGEGVLRRLVGTLRRRFEGGDDRAGTVALDRLEDAPDSASRVRELATLLDERAAADTSFRGELEALVEETRGAGIDVESISQVALGNRNVQVADVADSDISVTYGTRPDGAPPPRPGD